MEDSDYAYNVTWKLLIDKFFNIELFKSIYRIFINKPLKKKY